MYSKNTISKLFSYVLVASTMAEAVQSRRFVCHSVCVQDYCKSNQLISLKLGVMIGPNNWKNWLTIGGDPIWNMYYTLLVQFPHRCEMENSEDLLSLLVQSAADFHDTW